MEYRKASVPRHIGFIMDGNGRWAKAHGVSRKVGHQKGYEAMRNVGRWCKARGIEVATFFAFSTENWGRSKWEVAYLMRLMSRVLRDDVPELLAEGVRLRVIGHRGKPLTPRIIELIAKAEAQTAHASGLLMQIAINYGGRSEILAGTRQCMRDAVAGGLNPDDLTEETFSQRLWTARTPDPDLIIRTSGERRTSGFLTWSATYAELFLELETLWPGFSEAELDEILHAYANRERRFGAR